MIGEIDKEFYCTGNHFFNSGNIKVCMLKAKSFSDDAAPVNKGTHEGCQCYRHKHPTPEQFREEYGGEWQEGWPVWVLYREISKLCDPDTGKPYPDSYLWIMRPHKNKKDIEAELTQSNFYNNFPHKELECIVCACTPWSKPEDDWRPS